MSFARWTTSSTEALAEFEAGTDEQNKVYYAEAREHFKLSDDEVDEVIAGVDRSLLERTWLCEPSLNRVIELRGLFGDTPVRLLQTTRLDRIKGTPERRAEYLARHRIDGINLHRTDWSGGLVALFGSLAPGGAILKRSAADRRLPTRGGGRLGRAGLVSHIDGPEPRPEPRGEARHR